MGKHYGFTYEDGLMAHKSQKPTVPQRSLNFPGLVKAIRQAHEHCAAQASRAVNISLTMRNWLIGAYIHHYELNGRDWAEYGDGLLDALAERLTALKVSNCNRRQLYRYLRFFRAYPAIVGTLSPQLPQLTGLIEMLPVPVSRAKQKKVGTASPLSGAPAEQLVNRLSYSHLELIVDIDNPLQRAFYEIECIRGNWSVRELRRQIVTLYFERSGLSRDKKKLATMVKAGAEMSEPNLAIRDPYIFEFLGLKPREVMSESGIEDALLDKLQEFLLELGQGFCFEARQKSILIGKTRGFVDLVFYHRILKCHVLVELKVDEFRHEHIGQLNTYVTWFQKHVMAKGDNPPVGLLLCTRKDHALVEYALAGMDNRLFVSRYQLALPSKKDLTRFLETQCRRLTDG